MSQAPSRFLHFSLSGGLAGLISYCVLDFILVRVVPYPDHIHDCDWVAILFPFAVFASAVLFFRSVPLAERVWLIVGSTLSVLVVSVVLILLIGIPIFHFAIGGSL